MIYVIVCIRKLQICSIIAVRLNTGVVDGVIYVAVSADTCCG